MALDDFALKEQMQSINDNVKKTLGRQNKRLVKSKKNKDKDGQEGGTTFMITTAAAVWKVCMVEGYRSRERYKAEDKGKRGKRKSAADRANKKQGYSGGGGGGS